MIDFLINSRFLRIALVLLVFWAVTVGCAALSGTARTEIPDPDQIATSVAATLESILTPTASLTVPTPTSTTAPPTAEPSAAPSQTPALSPGPSAETGLTVAYISPNRELWIWEPDEEPRQLITTGDVDSIQISNDGEYIAFTRTTDYIHYSLWTVRSDGSEEQPVMDLPEFDALPRAAEAVSVMPAAFSWAPAGDRHLLVFNTRPTFDGPGLMMNNDLWFADIDEDNLQQVYPTGAGGQFHFSPDGSQLALVLPDSISLVNTDGSNRRDRVYVYPEVVTYSEYAFYANPEWADDSSHLKVVIPPQAALDRPEDPSTIWSIPADGAPAVAEGSFHTAPMLYPNLSPDLQRVAYLQQSGEPAENFRSLHISNVDGSDDQVYTEGGNLMFTSWAPDSRRFAFTLGESAQLMIGEIGQEARPADDLSAVSSLRWVDPERFLFITRSGGNAELRLWSINGDDVLVDRFEEGSGPLLSYDFVGQ